MVYRKDKLSMPRRSTMKRKSFPIIGMAVIALSTTGSAGGTSLSPPKKIVALEAQLKRLDARLTRLTAQVKTLRQDTATARRREAALIAHLTAAEQCPLSPASAGKPAGVNGTGWFGSDPLWVELQPSSVLVIRPGADGSLETKFPWWLTAAGRLSVEGKRLDGVSPPLTAIIAPGYGGVGIQPTRLHFPAPGCWQITGRVGNTSLIFVTLALPG
jgi:outer membrane murein-binding lipoprotein Lpp